MSVYKRSVRPGFTLYHEDLTMLGKLPPKQFKEFILSLAVYSEGLAAGEAPGMPHLTGWAEAMWGPIVRKIDRDHDQYTARCERNSRNRRATMVNDGQPSSPKEKENETVTEKEKENENENVNVSVSEIVTQTVSVTAPPAAAPAAEAAAPSAPAPAPAQDERPVAVPPTKKQIEDYCFSKGWKIDADRFIAYNEAKGWTVGKSRMTDWRPALRMWVQNESAPVVSRKILPEQNYSQRSYADEDPYAELAAQVEEFLRNGSGV